MKASVKIVSLLLLLASLFSLLTSCQPTVYSKIDSMTPAEILAEVYAKAKAADQEKIETLLASLVSIEITAENVEGYLGAVYPFAEGIASEPEMGWGYSVCIIKANAGEDIEKLRTDIEATANANRWVCVTAEEKVVKFNGNVVMLCMASKEICPLITAAFESIA